MKLLLLWGEKRREQEKAQYGSLVKNEANQAAYSECTVCDESWYEATPTDGRGWWKTQTLGMIRVHL